MTELKKISVSGDLGSGKSVTSKYIAGKLGYKYFSTGEIQRRMAEERGISVLEMNKVANINLEIDRKIDEMLVSIRQSDGGYILDSRLAWFFVPDSLKVYLRTNIEVTINRIMSDKKRRSESYSSRENARYEIRERKANENARFLQAYGADCGNLANYNAVIETTSVPPEDIGDLIIELAAKKGTDTDSQCWVSPKFMFPTRRIAHETRLQPLTMSPRTELAQEKIICLLYDGFYFIHDGHKRVSAALRNKVPLLPIEIKQVDAPVNGNTGLQDLVTDTLKNSLIADWEAMHGFSYEIYPHLDLVRG